MSIKPQIIDFSPCSIDLTTCSKDAKQQVGKQFADALVQDGCAYIINTGLPPEKVTATQGTFKKFWTLPEDVKLGCVRAPSDRHGYAHLYQEVFTDAPNAHKLEDYRESFNVIATADQPVIKWPDDAMPHFKPCMLDMLKSYYSLTHRCLEMLALGLGIEDETFFTKHHNFDRPSCTALRGLHYPFNPTDIDEEVPHDVQRMSAHRDFDCITFLVFDEEGFQVKLDDREWKSVERVPDAILVQCGATMKHWTAGKIQAIKHRVLWPDSLNKQQKARHSMAFFAHADDDAMISWIQPSDAYPPKLSSVIVDECFDGTIKVVPRNYQSSSP